MAFPLIALLTAAAGDLKSRSDYANQVQKAGNDAQNRILQTRARELGGSPYGMMAQEFESNLGDMRRQADAQRNNNIGALLQAYLKYGISKEGGGSIGNPDAPLASGWEDDPWGDAGF